MFIINFCLNMFRASLCPSSGEQRPCYCIWCIVLDAKIRCLLLISVSTCFGHLYAHLQENKDRYCIWCVVLDATIRCLLLISVSTCFGHLYAHLQENKGPVTAFGVLFCFCWMWLGAVVGRCVVGCEQCSHPTTQRQ